MESEMHSDGSVRPVKIGMSNALNAAPLATLWQETVSCQSWQMTEGRTDEISEKLAAGEIDLGFISSFAYGKNASDYLLLPGLSLSASTAAGVAILFSHVPLEQLAKSRLLLRPCASSAALVRLILEEWNGVTPEYVPGDIMALQESGQEFKAVLATGDDALRLVEKSDYLYQFDLGDIWKRRMELPFVFSVCAVRRQFVERFPDEVAAIHRQLLRCRDEGLEALSRICEHTASSIPFSTRRCQEYIEALEYNLSGKKRTALEKFFKLLIQRKELEETALPLEFFACDDDE